MKIERSPNTADGCGLEDISLKLAIVEFVRGASLEISTHDESTLPTLVTTLPRGSSVYVAHTPKATLTDVVQTAIKLQRLGFRAAPHIVARRIESREALYMALEQLSAAGVDQALLVAGDLPKPKGPFTSTLDVLQSCLWRNYNFSHVGVAGHPEGHKQVSISTLLSELQLKREIAAKVGLRLHLVSQFTFNPQAIVAWDEYLANHGVLIPAHVGIAGPTPLPKLLKYAAVCGVGASLTSLLGNMGAMASLLKLTTTPDEMTTALVRDAVKRGARRVVKPHFFAFGGVVATARWIRAVIDGDFTLRSDGSGFNINA